MSPAPTDGAPAAPAKAAETAEKLPLSTAVAEDPVPDAPAAAPEVSPLTVAVLKRYAYWAAGVVVVLGLLFWLLGSVMTPFVLGAIMAYMGHPLVEKLEAKKIPRAVGATIVIAVGIGSLVGLVFIVLPFLQAELSRLADSVPGLLNRAQTEWVPYIQQKFGITINLDVSKIRSWLAENLSDVGQIAKRIAVSLQMGGAALLAFIATALLTPLVTFYLLQDWPKVTRALSDLVPRGLLPRVLSILEEIDVIIAEFMRGQFSVMGVLAAYYAIALTIIGVEHGIAIGVLTGLLIFIPYIGFGLGCLLAGIAAVTQFSTWQPMAAVAAVYAIGQVVESIFLTPKLVGERVGLHPLAVLFALMAFGQLFGFVGVLIAVPASAILLVALRHLRDAYTQSDLYKNASQES
jgi:predicted PurR-regulated permease PerM